MALDSMACDMRSRILATLLAFALCWLAAAATLAAQTPQDAARAALVRWLDALDEPQRMRCLHAFEDPARRDWGYTPRQRVGLRVAGLGEHADGRLRELLASVLDSATLHTLEEIRDLERVLFERESRPGAPASWRDYDEYYVSVFGDPRSQERWAWRFEGHHISINFTGEAERVVSVTPQFLGANPARSEAGTGGERRPLAREEDLARELFASLDEEQLAKARSKDELTGDIRGAPGAEPPGPAGLRSAQLSPAQRALLVELVELFARRLSGSARDGALESLRAGLREGSAGASLAWAGSLAPLERSYWRVNVGAIVLEFDNSQPGANHVHTLWREHGADFGDARASQR